MKQTNEKIMFLVFLFAIVSVRPVYGHKLVDHDDIHTCYDSVLLIPDHMVSWAIYENLGVNEAKFYSFQAQKGDSFYASIVIPKLVGLEEYSPSFVLVSPSTSDADSKSIEALPHAEKFLYEGTFPGNEFYEPFGQVTYWERQEIRTEIPYDGTYFIVVLDEKNQKGKYSLAIGTIEDFSGGDLFVILPKAWFDTKLFVNDYLSIAIFFSVLVMVPTVLTIIIIRKRKNSLRNISKIQ